MATTISNSIDIPDNGKLLIGDSDDLQIYHDGSHSYVSDVGTGGLKLTGGDIYIRNPSDADMIYATSGGTVKLYHNGNEKLATTSTGVDVTGSVTCDDSIVIGGNNPSISFQDTTSPTADFTLKGTGDNFQIIDNRTSTTPLHINYNGKIGIGTNDPSELLEVRGASGTDGATPPTIKINSSTSGDWTDNATFARLAFGSEDTAGGIACSINAYVDSTSGNNSGLTFYTSASANTPVERVRIDKAGKVGIGTDSPSAVLEVAQPSSGAAIIARTNESTASQRAGGGFSSVGSGTATSRIAHMWLDADGANFSGSDYFYIHKKGNSGEAALIQQSNADLKFATNGTTRMIISATGDVGLKKANATIKQEADNSSLRLTGGNSYIGGAIKLMGGSNGGQIHLHSTTSTGNYGTAIASVTADGITFNGDTVAANALNDYEEGVHVVTATDSGGGATYGLNSPADTLAYTKVGRLVTITGALVCTTVTGTPTGTIQLSLPFACANLSEHGGKSGGAGVGYYQVQKYTSGVFPQLSIAEGTSIATLYYGVVDANQYETYFNTSSQVYCNFSYFTA